MVTEFVPPPDVEIVTPVAPYAVSGSITVNSNVMRARVRLASVLADIIVGLDTHYNTGLKNLSTRQTISEVTSSVRVFRTKLCFSVPGKWGGVS
jgi:hypothetical protein